MAVDLAQIIPPLARAKVNFILIGGMAAILHGSARVTFVRSRSFRAPLQMYRSLDANSRQGSGRQAQRPASGR